MVVTYSWLSEQLRTEFEEIRLLKESPRGNVRLIRHRSSGRQFILHRFQGNREVIFRYVYAPTQKELSAKLRQHIDNYQGADLTEQDDPLGVAGEHSGHSAAQHTEELSQLH